MLFSITSTSLPATDLGYLLYKHSATVYVVAPADLRYAETTVNYNDDQLKLIGWGDVRPKPRSKSRIDANPATPSSRCCRNEE